MNMSLLFNITGVSYNFCMQERIHYFNMLAIAEGYLWKLIVQKLSENYWLATSYTM